MEELEEKRIGEGCGQDYASGKCSFQEKPTRKVAKAG